MKKKGNGGFVKIQLCIYHVGIGGILPKPQKWNEDLSKEFYSCVELANYFKINIIPK